MKVFRAAVIFTAAVLLLIFGVAIFTPFSQEWEEVCGNCWSVQLMSRLPTPFHHFIEKRQVPSWQDSSAESGTEVQQTSPDNPGLKTPGRGSVWRAKEKARFESIKQALEIERLLSTQTYFEAKHVYQFHHEGGQGHERGFQAPGDPKAKQYLLDLNRKLAWDGLLHAWTKKRLEERRKSTDEKTEPKKKKKKLSKENTTAEETKPPEKLKTELIMIDDDLGELLKDLTAPGRQADSNGNIATEGTYKVIHLILEEKNSSGKLEVVVYAETGNAYLKVALNSKQELAHLDGIKWSESEATPPPVPIEITSFSETELLENHERTESLWKTLGVLKTMSGFVLKEEDENFRILKEDADKEFWKISESDNLLSRGGQSHSSGDVVCKEGSRRKRGACGGGELCAVYLKSDGTVEFVDRKAYAKAYTNAHDNAKRRLQDTVKLNVNKLSLLEGVTAHVQLTESVAQLQDVDKLRVSGPNSDSEDMKPSEILVATYERFSEVETQGRVKLSGSKIAHSLTNSEMVRRSTKSITSLSGKIGNFLLVKSIVTGIYQGDVTSLAFLGGRIGWDVGTRSVAWAGAKYLSETSKLGKIAKFVGKIGGPVGAFSDIILSGVSLWKSVERLKSANSTFDRGDAISDVVADSIDTAVSVEGFAISSLLRAITIPLAPELIAAGFAIDFVTRLVTTSYQSVNAVARITSEIKLSRLEKVEVFTSRFFESFGAKQEVYIADLIDEKHANELAVGSRAEFLKQNPSLLGIVFPSMALAEDGSCRLEKVSCIFKIFWCLSQNTEIVRTKCNWNRPCSNQNKFTCAGYTLHGYADDFRCVCEKMGNFPRRNSIVDFREKQRVHWDRAGPKGEWVYKCKPGLPEIEFNHYISEENTREDYLCENAVAIVKSEEKGKAGQAMMFALEDGLDTVLLSGEDLTPNFFQMGYSGWKYFEGGAGRNEFYFDGNCSSDLEATLKGGKGENDVISLATNCSSGEWIHIDFVKGDMYNEKGNLRVKFKSVEEIKGRPLEGDSVVLGCDTRKVDLLGGNEIKRDFIFIPDQRCNYNVSIVVAEFTSVISLIRNGELNLSVGPSFKNATLRLEIYPGSSPNIAFRDTPSSEIYVNAVSIWREDIGLRLTNSKNHEIQFIFNIRGLSPEKQRNFMIFVSEDGEMDNYSVLTFPVSSLEYMTPVFYHSLNFRPLTPGLFSRKGCRNVPNEFEIVESGWEVIGGDNDDKFILHTMEILHVHGGDGDDTITLHEDLAGSEITLNFASSPGVFKNIEHVFDTLPQDPLTVIVDCSTKSVSCLGGSAEEADLIIVPKFGFCHQRNLEIFARGHSHVLINDDSWENVRVQDKVAIILETEPTSNSGTNIVIDILAKFNESAKVSVILHTKHDIWTGAVTNENLDEEFSRLIIRLQGMNDELVTLEMNIMKSTVGKFPPQGYLPTSLIQILNPVESPVELLVDEKYPHILRAFHYLELSLGNGTLVPTSGFPKISNIFRVLKGSWNLTGGTFPDTFVMKPDPKDQMFVDGCEIDSVQDDKGNTLILEVSEQQSNRFRVNLLTGDMGFFRSSSSRSSVKCIQKVIGRDGQPDTILTSCDTEFVDMKGGWSEAYDNVFVHSSSDCEQNLLIEVDKFTHVHNMARRGEFTYNILEPQTSILILNATEYNEHLLIFQSMEILEEVKFDDVRHELLLKLCTTSQCIVHAFTPFRANNSDTFTNPVFQFHEPGTAVYSQLIVSKDGATSAKIEVGSGILSKVGGGQVTGIPIDVNKFIINILAGDDDSRGRIKGSSFSSSNQFWIFSLGSPLEELDGGDCIENNCTNFLHISETVESGKVLEVRLDKNTNGFIRSNNSTFNIFKLGNIHKISGRRSSVEYDKIHVSSCDVQQISGFEEILITVTNCTYDLIVVLDEHTELEFMLESGGNLTWNLGNTFRYKFIHPRDFHVESSDFSWLGANHIFDMPFTLDELEELYLSPEDDHLVYKISGVEYSIGMLFGAVLGQQFYYQPKLVSKDKFTIKVSSSGDIILVKNDTIEFTRKLNEIQSKIVPSLQNIAKRLGVTIIHQSEENLIHVGDFVNNVGFCRSHLVGGCSEKNPNCHIIYEIVNLTNDVYIYSGNFGNEPDCNLNGPMETLDLTDVVIPIRLSSRQKYVPKVVQIGEDLKIRMEGYRRQFPGEIVILNGAQECVFRRMQILLNHVMMELTREDGNWRIVPKPAIVPEGFVYSLAIEDLEEDLEIKFAKKLHTHFNLTFSSARNVDDLHVSDIASFVKEWDDSQNNTGIEMTTLIITDFFKSERLQGSMENDTDHFPTLPKQVSNVTIHFPGISLVLNGTEIFEIGETQPISENSTLVLGTSSRGRISSHLNITDWNLLVDQVLHDIVNDTPVPLV